MQTLLDRVGNLLTGFLSLTEPPEGHDPASDSAATPNGDRADDDRLPERDESYYWAMHAHW